MGFAILLMVILEFFQAFPGLLKLAIQRGFSRFPLLDEFCSSCSFCVVDGARFLANTTSDSLRN